MELQRVLAHDTRKAMEKVYELYGEDAMVVSNSRTHNQTELVVAIDLATQAMDALSETPVASPSTRREALGEMPNFDSVLESHLRVSKVESLIVLVRSQMTLHDHLLIILA